MIITKYKLFLESQSENMWNIIPESVKDLHALFKKNGKKLFVVGGAVRDFINNETPKDFDLCTDALPNEVVNIIGNKWRTTLQGQSFGVVVVYTDDQPKGMEIATFREDQYGDKLGITRNPDVKYSTIDKDVQRRDITFNALFYDLEKKEIIDLVDGVKDIKDKITKFIGEPNLRIKEDPLRILRILRFTCRYQFKLDSESFDAIKANKSSLSIISKERIWAMSGDNPGEIMKAWKQSKSFSQYLNLFTDLDLWSVLLPGLEINTNIKDSEYLECYFANLLKNNDTRILTRRLIQEFKMETEFARKVIALVNLLNLTPFNVTDMYKQINIAAISKQVMLDWFQITGIKDRMFMAFLTYRPSVSSEDLMKQGFSGPELGREIKRREAVMFSQSLKLFEAYSQDDEINDDKLLIEQILKDYIEQVKFIDDEKFRTWQGLEIGDTTTYPGLPSSQAEPPKGRYILSVISIKKTDHYLMGVVDRSYFDEDDYDNWQTENLNMIKSEFDTSKREPIIVIEGADGLYSVVDGHHRLVIANELGRQSILALVIKNDTSNKLEWQESLKDIAQLYIKAKAGNLKWTKDRTSKFISWLETYILWI